MHRIDWSRFAGNVRRYMGPRDYRSEGADPYSASSLEMHMSYARPEIQAISDDQAGRWSRPTPEQPTEEQRDAILRVMDWALAFDDTSYFASSMEGDFCLWNVHLAAKTERGDAFTAGDWQSVHYLCGTWPLERLEDWGDEVEATFPAHSLPEAIERLRLLCAEVASRYERAETIFTELLS